MSLLLHNPRVQSLLYDPRPRHLALVIRNKPLLLGGSVELLPWYNPDHGKLHLWHPWLWGVHLASYHLIQGLLLMHYSMLLPATKIDFRVSIVDIVLVVLEIISTSLPLGFYWTGDQTDYPERQPPVQVINKMGLGSITINPRLLFQVFG
ncbi:hypothetical protein B0H14DRAFT_3146099, partial [Mycena olivaceomarginata]